jgi:hypothetical protein
LPAAARSAQNGVPDAAQTLKERLARCLLALGKGGVKVLDSAAALELIAAGVLCRLGLTRRLICGDVEILI